MHSTCHKPRLKAEENAEFFFTVLYKLLTGTVIKERKILTYIRQLLKKKIKGWIQQTQGFQRETNQLSGYTKGIKTGT